MALFLEWKHLILQDVNLPTQMVPHTSVTMPGTLAVASGVKALVGNVQKSFAPESGFADVRANLCLYMNRGSQES